MAKLLAKNIASDTSFYSFNGSPGSTNAKGSYAGSAFGYQSLGVRPIFCIG